MCLLGSIIKRLLGSKFQLIGDVPMLYVNMLKLRVSRFDAAVTVVKDVQLFLEKARIPMRRVDHTVSRLEDLVKQPKALKKS